MLHGFCYLRRAYNFQQRVYPSVLLFYRQLSLPPYATRVDMFQVIQTLYADWYR